MADATEALVDFPPSAKLVYFVLRQHGPMTQKDLTEESLLSPRTVRYAINRLEGIDILTERKHLMDARQTIYEISVAGGDNTTEHCGTTTAADD